MAQVGFIMAVADEAESLRQVRPGVEVQAFLRISARMLSRAAATSRTSEALTGGFPLVERAS
jgi:hypothetical protein